MAGYPKPGRDVASDPVREYLQSLPDRVALAEERGQPVVFVCDQEPEEHVRLLMRTLGVRVEVRPVTAVAVNQDVKVAAGSDGAIVVVSAYCPTCRLEAMPNVRGECSFCGTTIVDEDRLSARAMRDQIANGVPAKTEAAAPAAAKKQRGRIWTRGEVVAAILAFHAEHGRVPGADDWRHKDPDGKRPTVDNVQAIFGKWSEGIRAAGFTPRRRGERIDPGPALSEREPQGHGGRTPVPPASPRTAASPAAGALRDGFPGPGVAEPGSRSENADPADAPPGFARALIKAARAFADTLEQELG